MRANYQPQLLGFIVASGVVQRVLENFPACAALPFLFFRIESDALVIDEVSFAKWTHPQTCIDFA